MRLSVIIPTYNCGPLVAEAVRSVLTQTRAANEIIVVDDGSSDDTATQLAPFADKILVIHQANAGVAMARNAGVAAATGELVAFLDADDVWHPRKLELQRPYFDDAKLGLLASDPYPWPGVQPDLPAVIPALRPVPLHQLVVRNCIVTSSVIVRVTVLRAAGEFDSRLHGPEDYDLWLRVAQHSTVACLPVPVTGYRTVTGSLSANAAKMEEGMMLILAKLEPIFARRPLLRRKAWAYCHYSCGYMHSIAGHRAKAIGHLTRSLLGYPLPYSRADVRHPFGRLRLLLSALLKESR